MEHFCDSDKWKIQFLAWQTATQYELSLKNNLLKLQNKYITNDYSLYLYNK